MMTTSIGSGGGGGVDGVQCIFLRILMQRIGFPCARAFFCRCAFKRSQYLHLKLYAEFWISRLGRLCLYRFFDMVSRGHRFFATVLDARFVFVGKERIICEFVVLVIQFLYKYNRKRQIPLFQMELFFLLLKSYFTRNDMSFWEIFTFFSILKIVMKVHRSAEFIKTNNVISNFRQKIKVILFSIYLTFQLLYTLGCNQVFPHLLPL